MITLLTDFGTQDSYVGVMKGVILSSCPDTPIIDLSHEIPPQNVDAGSFTWLEACAYFPKTTLHVGVVDPGVGSRRKILALQNKVGLFLAPDNGLLTDVIKQWGCLNLHSVDNSELFLNPVSSTFHGRDIFSPVAAQIASGLPLNRLGPQLNLEDIELLPDVMTSASEESLGWVQGRIRRVDRFGNAISDLQLSPSDSISQIQISSLKLPSLRNLYSEVGPGEPLALIGSSGFLEISVSGGSAAERYQIEVGDPLRVKKGNRADSPDNATPEK